MWHPSMAPAMKWDASSWPARCANPAPTSISSGLGKWITSPETVPTEDSGIVWSYIRHISMMSMSYENIILYLCQLNIMQLNKNIM